ncbi:DMT family transporter [Vagococcus hydrophili]|uniref:DMT family transporter n=1 Tax=Vagococcus hydrophili TaxID=2714947 RepID=A0A6G8ATA4_9ENTE|nr:DMT family transporter [Vagococcus hydrophili]QIL48311.1 DMT family transporter [Vagococcus hydrophili]
MKIISIFIGALITIMIALNGILSQYLGNYVSSVIIHLLGLIGMIFILIVTKTKIKYRNNLRWYFYSAGIIGVFTVIFNNISFAALGVSLTVSLGLLGQSLSSLVIDHFGLLGMNKALFESKKIIGIVFILLGIIVMSLV